MWGCPLFAGSGDTYSVTLSAVDMMTPVLKSAGDSLALFAGTAERTMYGLGRLTATLGPIAVLGAAFLTAGKAASTVEQNVANLNSVLHGTADQLKAVRDAGLSLSQATQFTDAQILASQRQLAKAGMDAQQIIRASPSVTNLAGAAQDTPANAANSITTVTKAFRLGGQDVATTADQIAQAVDTSIGTLTDFSNAMKQAGPTAHAASLSFKDTAAAVDVLQNAGLRGDAGTSLKTFLARIEAPTATAKAQIDALGLSFFTMGGQLKPLGEIFDELKVKEAGLSDETKDAANFKIFGQRGVRAADIFAESGSQGFNEQTSRMDEMGSAADINARKIDTLAGSVAKLSSTANTLAVQAGQALTPTIRGATDGMLAFGNAVSKAANANQTMTQVVVGGALIGGLMRVGGLLGDRANKRADEAGRPARDAAAAEAAARQRYSEQIAQAEFTADSRIASAHQELDQQMMALDAQRYDAYLALEEKTTAALVEADARKLASLQTITEATMGSIAEIEAAQLAASRAQAERGEIDVNRQRALLAVRQEGQVAGLAVSKTAGGFSPDTQLARTQAVERETLEKEIAVRQQFAAEEAAIDQRTYRARVDRAMAAGERQIAAEERASEGRVAAIVTGHEASLVAEEAGYAREVAAAEAAARAKVVAAEAAARNVTGSQLAGTSYGASGTAADTLAAATKVEPVVTATPSLIAATRGKVAGVMGTVGKALGETVMPALIAISVVDMVIKPIEQSIIDRAVKNDPQLQQLTVRTSLVADPRALDATIEQRHKIATDDLADINKQIAETTAKLGQQKQPYDYPGILKPFTGFTSGGAASDKDIKETEGKLTKLEELRKQAEGIIADTGPEKQKSALAEQKSQVAEAIGQIVALYDSGAITMTEAVNKANDAAFSFLSGPDADSTHKQMVSDAQKTLEQHKSAIDQAKRIDEQAYQDKLDLARKARKAGADEETISVGVFGTGSGGEEVTVQQENSAKKHIADLEKAAEDAATRVKDAWTQAMGAVGKVDISKGGVEALAGNADALERAARDLAAAGQSDLGLSHLADMAGQFKQITDATEKASGAFDTYLLKLDTAESGVGKADALKRRVLAAYDAAQARANMGTANDADRALLAQGPNIVTNLNNQIAQMQQGEGPDLLGVAKNAPDWNREVDQLKAKIDEFSKDRPMTVDVKTTVDQTTKDIQALLDKEKYKIDIEVTVTPPEYAKFLGKGPDGRSVSPYDELPPAPPPPGAPGTTGPSRAYEGNPMPFPGPATGSGTYPSTPFTGLGPTTTPHGDANLVLPYSEIIKKAAAQYGVPEWVIAAIVMHESSGTAGITNSIGASGLMQVLPGGTNPDGTTWNRGYSPADMSLLRGTDTASANFQIQQGTKIFREFLDADKGDYGKALNDYGGGIPDYWKTLQQQYQQPIKNVLYGGSGGPTTSGPGAGATQTDIFGDTALGVGSNLNKLLAGDGKSGAGIDVSKIVQEAKKHLGEVTQINGLPWDEWCEKFVDDMLQQSLGKDTRFGSAEKRIDAARAGVAGAGTVIDRAQARPGDLVGLDTSSPYSDPVNGHIGIYAGQDKSGQDTYIGTSPAGIQQRVLPPGAIFIRPDGVVADGPVPGSVTYTAQPHGSSYTQSEHGQTAASTATGGNVDLTKQPAQPYVPQERKIDFSALTASLQHLAPADLNETIKGAQLLEQTFEKLALAKLPPELANLPSEKWKAAADAQQQMAQSAPVLAKMYDAISHHVADISTMFPEIEQATGPLAGYFEKQALALQDVDRAGQAVLKDQGAITELERGHTAVMAARAKADQADSREQTRQGFANQIMDAERQKGRTGITEMQADEDRARQHSHELIGRQVEDESRQRERSHQLILRDLADEDRQRALDHQAIQRREQDEDTARERSHTLEQRAIDDTRTAEQRLWQDMQQGLQDQVQVINDLGKAQDLLDRTRTESADDAYRTLSRQEEDQKRYLDFIGSERKKQLTDEMTQMDLTHSRTTRGMDVSQRLLVDTGKGQATEGAALAYASQAAAINDARKQADLLYQDQKDDLQRQIDLEDKAHAQVMYDLETQTIAAARVHEDELLAIQREEEARHDAAQRELDAIAAQERADTAAQLVITRGEQDLDRVRQRAYEDESFRIAQTRLDEQRRWEDEQVSIDATRLAQSRRWEDEQVGLDADNLARQRGWEDDQYRLDYTRTQQARRWEEEDRGIADARLADQMRYQEKRFQIEDERAIEDAAYTQARQAADDQLKADQSQEQFAKDRLSAAQNLEGWWQQVEGAVGGSANALLNMAHEVNTLASQTAAQASYNQQVAGLATSAGVSYGDFPAPGQSLPTHAAGGLGAQGLNLINEKGGELRLLTGGEAVIPADETRRMMDLVLGKVSQAATSAAPVFNEGDVTIQLGDDDLAALSPRAKARIRAVVHEELDAARGTSVRERMSATGILRRA